MSIGKTPHLFLEISKNLDFPTSFFSDFIDTFSNPPRFFFNDYGNDKNFMREICKYFSKFTYFSFLFNTSFMFL